jgi:hypothetical protein
LYANAESAMGTAKYANAKSTTSAKSAKSAGIDIIKTESNL